MRWLHIGLADPSRRRRWVRHDHGNLHLAGRALENQRRAAGMHVRLLQEQLSGAERAGLSFVIDIGKVVGHGHLPAVRRKGVLRVGLLGRGVRAIARGVTEQRAGQVPVPSQSVTDACKI
jgi:hypothetical protein